MRVTLSRKAKLASLALIPLVFMAAQPVADGMSYDFTMKTTNGGKETTTMTGRGIYAGDDSRIEIQASSGPGGQEAFGGKGGYFIVKDGGKEMFVVNPGKKEYMKWDMNSLFAGLGAAVNVVSSLVKVEMSDVKIDAQEVGAGPSLQGHATRHYRMVQNYTMTTRMFGRTSKNRSESTTDIYVAPSVRFANPFVTNSEQLAMLSQLDMFNNPEYKTQMAAANARLPKSGVPLRTVTTTVTTDDKGKAETSISTMEVSNLKAGNFPPSTFEIPANYTQVELAVPAGQVAEGEDGKAAGEKPDAKEAATKAIRGIFGGKKR